MASEPIDPNPPDADAPPPADPDAPTKRTAARRVRKPAKLRAVDPVGEAGAFDPNGGYNLTDLGNAKRLVSLHGHHLRYCYEWRSWLIWDGKRWKRDADGEISRRAKDSVSNMIVDYEMSTDADERERLFKHMVRSESARGIENMIRLAQSEPGVACSSAKFDSDPWLFNCLTGTIDLRTGRQHDHDQREMITKLAPVDYDPTARSDTWERFLESSQNGDADVIAFLRRAAGYSLTGDTREEKLFFVHGPSGSGKSTFLEALKAMLGDYAKTTDFEAFIARPSNGGAREDIARLVGARMVVSIEVDEGKKLAEGLVKTLTGGDTVAARFMYEGTFEFRPQFKLWLAANDAPRVRDTDAAMWRRILRVPFDRAVPANRRDSTIKRDLTNTKLCGPAILAWCIAGCLEWQRRGLGVPESIEAATAQYRDSMDPLADFFADRCTFNPEARVIRKALWAEYERWAKDNGVRFTVTRKVFGQRVRGRLASEFGASFKADGKMRAVGDYVPLDAWNGVSIVSSADDDAGAETEQHEYS